MTDAAELGAEGEEMATQLLAEQGYRIRLRNVRLRAGEIDIVAEDGEITVFVEVRTRRGFVGDAAGSLSASKRRRMLRCATEYCENSAIDSSAARIDVVAIDLPRFAGGERRIEHFRGVATPG